MKLALPWAFLTLATGKQTPAALEASYKERIEKVLNRSASLAAEHLAQRLSLDPGSLFGGYELDYERKSWAHGCLGLALTALCDVPLTTAGSSRRQVVEDHLMRLLAEEIPELGMRLQKTSAGSIFLLQKPTGEDASPAVQASLLMAAVRCGEALSLKVQLEEASAWFQGLSSIYPENLWKESFSSFHRAGITWEALAVTKRHIGKDSNFHRELENYLHRFELFLRDVWEENSEHWSFASARALSVRFAVGLFWAFLYPEIVQDSARQNEVGLRLPKPTKIPTGRGSSPPRKKKARSRFRTWASEHVDRFLGRQHLHLKDGPEGLSQGILARIGGARYTCGPLQGLASLAAILKDAELIQVVLQLMEKDIRRYQLSDSNLGPLQGSNEEFELLSSHLEGSFFRDEEQLRLEDRKTLRVDDTAMCLIAVSQMLETMKSIKAYYAQGTYGMAPRPDLVLSAGEFAPNTALGAPVPLQLLVLFCIGFSGFLVLWLPATQYGVHEWTSPPTSPRST
eukprot:g1287.t1